MDAIFINSENSKTSEPYRTLLIFLMITTVLRLNLNKKYKLRQEMMEQKMLKY